MVVDEEKLVTCLGQWAEIFRQLESVLEEAESKGPSCAVGTLSARMRQVEGLVQAFDARKANERDLLKIENAAEAMPWPR